MRPSSIDRMPKEVRDEIKRLRLDGRHIDEIIEHLRTMGAPVPSRTALGRHIKGFDKLGDLVRRTRAVSEGLAQDIGNAPESQTLRVNIELLHGALLDVFMRAAEGETIDEAARAALAGDPEGAMMLAKTLDHLSRASKNNVEFVKKAEEIAAKRAKEGAARAVEATAKAQGLSRETIETIKTAIFGVKA